MKLTQKLNKLPDYICYTGLGYNPNKIKYNLSISKVEKEWQISYIHICNDKTWSFGKPDTLYPTFNGLMRKDEIAHCIIDQIVCNDDLEIAIDRMLKCLKDKKTYLCK